VHLPGVLVEKPEEMLGIKREKRGKYSGRLERLDILKKSTGWETIEGEA